MSTHHRAIVPISQQQLEMLLQLPDGLHIIGVRDDWAVMGVRILIEGDALAPVDEHVEPPVLFGNWRYDTATKRLEWDAPAP